MLRRDPDRSSFPSLLAAIALSICLVLPCVGSIAHAQSDDEASGVKLKPVPDDHVARIKEGTKLFQEQVRAVLSEHCLRCHGGEALKGDFDLSSREALADSGMLGDDAASSHLFAVITHSEEPHMPKDGERLPDETIAVLEHWINLGAPYDKPLVERTGDQAQKPSAITDDDRRFWSFQPLQPVAPPDVRDASWVRTPIDRFMLRELEDRGIAPNPIADRRTLIRRAYFDLIGLPPAPEQIDAFVNDPDPSAYEKLIDTLLESPHYGERWARHWMDVARFAESHGYEQDYDRPHAYPYRDFLIKAFNQDMPYDQFIKWQLAGDELAPHDPLALTATGFLGAGAFPTQLTEMEFESARYDELDDMGSTLGSALLGLSIGCARCHDHKYDPIPASDYYRLIASFTKTIRTEYEIDLDPEGNRLRQQEFESERAELQNKLDAFERHHLHSALQQWLAANDPNTAEGLDEATKKALVQLKQSFDTASDAYRTAANWMGPSIPEWKTLKQQLDDYVKAGPKLNVLKAQITSEGLPHMSHHADDRGFPHFYPETHILMRGDVHQKKELATPSYLQVLMRNGYDQSHWRVSPPEGWKRTGFDRASLGNWITDPQHGAGHLAARVIVNRLWQHHFGRGIVATPNDFGAQGEKPTHPELLDWLATDLIHNGWRLKRLHKLIMTSAVYMQSGEFDEQRAAIDRENQYLWRRAPRRLEAEAIRDSLLHVSGMLDTTMYGPGTLDPNMRRRSVYFFIKRSQLIPMMMLFDWPEHLVSIGQRASTTIAPQALAFMNSPQCRQYADGFAQRISALPQEEAVRTAYRLAFGRLPSDREQQLSLEFLVQQQSAYQVAGMQQPEHQALVDFCQTLISMNEFVYID